MEEVWNEQVGHGYDPSSAHMDAPEVFDPTVDFLAQWAGRGPALEFAVGTGRVALPLAARGVPSKWRASATRSPRPLTWGVVRAARDSNPQPPDP